jgi:hypothetical protein
MHDRVNTWWWSISIRGVLVEVGRVELILDFWHDRRMKTAISQAFPIETVEPPEVKSRKILIPIVI